MPVLLACSLALATGLPGSVVPRGVGSETQQTRIRWAPLLADPLHDGKLTDT